MTLPQPEMSDSQQNVEQMRDSLLEPFPEVELPSTEQTPSGRMLGRLRTERNLPLYVTMHIPCNTCHGNASVDNAFYRDRREGLDHSLDPREVPGFLYESHHCPLCMTEDGKARHAFPGYVPVQMTIEQVKGMLHALE
jgi:hypothetical protein